MIIYKSILLYRVGFFVCAILGVHFKALYYNGSINTLYIYMLIYGLCVAYMRCGYIKACNSKDIYRTWAHITAMHITALYNTVRYIRVVYISMGI